MRRLLERRRKPKAKAVRESGFHNVGQSSERESLSALPMEGPSESPSQDLWDRAYKLLQEDKDSRKVIETYEKVLLSLLNDEDDSPTGSIAVLDKEKQLSELIVKRLQIVEDARWKFEIGNQTIEVKAQVDRIVKTVIFAKDFVSSAVSSDPHAALAWAGVCVLMPFLLNPTAQQQALIKGLDIISDIICRYRVVEVTHRQQKAETLATQAALTPLDEASKSLDAQVTKVYSQILRYQAQVVCQLLRPAMIQYARDVFKADGWAALLAEIVDADSACQKLISVIDSGRLKNGFKEQAWRMDNLENALRLELIRLNQDNVAFARDIQNDRLQRQDWHQSDEESKCLQTLYHCDYKAQKARIPDRVTGTCQWLLRNEIFQHWFESTLSDLLWVTADPGCGKSVLSKSLIDNELRGTVSRVTAYFFFRDDNHDQRRATTALCALLHQILVHLGPKSMRKAVDVFKSHGPQLTESFTVLWDLLLEVCEETEACQVVCVIDALDECEGVGRELLIDCLNAFSTSARPCTAESNTGCLKFFVTSRPYHDIQHRFDRRIVRLAGEEETELVRQEIDLVIRYRVPKVASQLNLDANTQCILQQRLLDADNRTYLWLHLILEDILKRSVRVQTPKKLERFMNELPTSIYEAYDHMLQRSPDPEAARKLLHIVLAAVRPLTLREMNMALNIEDGQESREDVDLDPEDDFAAHLRNICGLFVFISGVDSKIYLIHQTAKEFLVDARTTDQDSNSDSPASGMWKHTMDPGVSHRTLAQVCINYLSFSTFETEPFRSESEKEDGHLYRSIPLGPRYTRYLKTHEFLDYAAKYWAFHFRHARISNGLITGWALICKPSTARFDTWFQIHYFHLLLSNVYNRVPYDPQLPSLVLASMLGHPVIVEEEASKLGPETREIHGRKSLWWAAMNCHESVVRKLLEKGLGSASALQIALHEHGESIHPLIEYGARADPADREGPTRLLGGVRRPLAESKPILNLLTAHGAKIDRITELLAS